MAPKVVADRRRDIAYVFLLVSACGFWFGLKPGHSPAMGPIWWSVLFSSALLVLAVGIWRAAEWARTISGGLAAVEAIRFAAGLVRWLSGDAARPDLRTIEFATWIFFALFWGAMAYYLLKPTTKRLFAHVRAARSKPQAKPS